MDERTEGIDPLEDDEYLDDDEDLAADLDDDDDGPDKFDVSTYAGALR